MTKFSFHLYVLFDSFQDSGAKITPFGTPSLTLTLITILQGEQLFEWLQEESFDAWSTFLPFVETTEPTTREFENVEDV